MTQLSLYAHLNRIDRINQYIALPEPDDVEVAVAPKEALTTFACDNIEVESSRHAAAHATNLGIVESGRLGALDHIGVVKHPSELYVVVNAREKNICACANAPGQPAIRQRDGGDREFVRGAC